MNTKPSNCIESNCGLAKLYVAPEMAAGAFHDFTMELKAMAIDRMVSAHQQHQEEIIAYNEQEQKLAEPIACAEESCAQPEG